MTRDPAPLWRLALSCLCILVACGGDGQQPPGSGSATGPDATIHLLTFSRLQGYAEGIPCADGPQPMAGAGLLRSQLIEQGDAAVLACVGDSLQHSAFVINALAAKQGALARGRVVLDAMAAANVDVYVPSHGDFIGGVEALLDDAAARGIDVLVSNLEYEGRDMPRYKIVEHNGLRVALLGLIAPESGDSTEDPKLRIIRPARRVRAICDEIAEQGLANLIVAYSNLSGKANQTLCDAIPELHFIVGSSDTGLKADRAVRRHGTTMLPLRTAGRELGQTSLRVVGGDFDFLDLSQTHVLPEENAEIEAALANYAELYGTSDPEELAPLVMPGNEQRFLDKYTLMFENKAWLEQMADYAGSSIEHFRAELPEPGPDDPVVAALREQGPAIQRAMAAIERAPKPLDEQTEVSRPEDCISCHSEQYQFWQGTGHATSQERLVAAGRDQDSHCQMCHVAAYGDRGGFDDPRLNAPFGGVTCFVCHIANRSHATVPRITVDPLYVSASIERMTCDRCHTQRRTPGFDQEAVIAQVSCPPMRPDEPALVEAYRKALRAYESRREDGRDTPRDAYLEGRALIGLGRRDEGVAAILAYADSNTTLPGAAIEVAGFLDERGLSHSAIRVLSDFLQHMPTEPSVNQGLLQLLVNATDPTARQPQEVLKRVPLLFPEDAETDSSSMPFRILYVDALFALDRRTAGTQMLLTLKSVMPAHDLVLERMERYGIEE